MELVLLLPEVALDYCSTDDDEGASLVELLLSVSTNCTTLYAAYGAY